MSRDVARVDVPALLAALRIEAKRDGKRWIAKCPNPEHADRSPSWSIVDTGSHYCFSCGLQGGPWELVASVRSCSLAEAGRWIAANVGRVDIDSDLPTIRIGEPTRAEFALPWGVQIPSVDGSTWFAPALDYLDRRGVTRAQIERWRIGFAISGRCAMRVVVPVVTRGRLLSYVARAFVNDGRARYDTPPREEPGVNPAAAIFGEPAFERVDADGRRGVVTVTEGVFKSLAMERAGAPNPCAILGAKNMGPEKIATLATFRVVLVATDPDDAGDRAFDVLAESLARYSDVRRVPMDRAPDDADEDENRAAWITAARRRRKA